MESTKQDNAPKKLADALLADERIRELPSTEYGIVMHWIAGGMTPAVALARIEQDLEDAATEDGYDGP